MLRLTCWILLLRALMIDGFTTSTISSALHSRHGARATAYGFSTGSKTRTTGIFLSKGFGKQNISARNSIPNKGGGNVKQQQNKEQGSSNKKATIQQQQEPTETDAVASTRAATKRTATTLSTTSSSSSMNSGQQALQDLRRQAAEKKDAELRKVRDVVAQDAQMASSSNALEGTGGGGGGAAIPEKVAQRILQRMIPFVGLPLVGGMGMFVVFWYLAVYRDLEYQPVVVATSTFVLLALGLFGITYSVLSASWDPERSNDGSNPFGWDEFQTNVQTLREGLSRSRENAMVREQMARLTPDEIQLALRDLQQREEQAAAAAAAAAAALSKPNPTQSLPK